MRTQIYIFLLALSMTACASVHPGKLGRSLSPQAKIPLQVSARNLPGEDDDALQLIEFTLENTSGDWLKFDKAAIVFSPNDTAKTSAVLGNDLQAWAQASRARQKVEKQNRQMLQSGLIVAGAVASIAGGYRGDSGLAGVGSAVVVGTYAWAAADTIESSLHAAETSEKTPENHLYHSVTVPPKMFQRRWLLLNKPVGMLVKTLVIEFETVEGSKETYAINL